MHYYQFNIADYRKDTTHLSPIEHYIYRQLIDWYYLDETPIPRETQVVIRRLGLGSDGLSNLENVLNDFFENTDSGWKHKRIEAELDKYRQKGDIARENGRKGGRPKKQGLSEEEKPRKTQPVIFANPEETGSKANHKPITTNQKEKKEKKESWNLPKEVDPEIWAEFEQHRKDIRKPLTDQARTKNANILKLLPVDKQRQCVDTTIAQRWTGVFPPKAEPKPKRNGSGTAEDVGRAYEAEFGKPPPPGKTTDEVRTMISQRREKTETWLSG